jgi:hypothetical protein
MMRTSLLSVALSFALATAVIPSLTFAQDNQAPAPTAPPPTYDPATAPPQAAPVAPAPAPVNTAPSMAVAAATPGPALKGFSAWGILSFGFGYGGSGYGAGARFMLPLSIQPLLHANGIRDSFALEFGADLTHYSYDYLGANDYSYTQFTPVAGVMWNIWLNQQLALYPKVEAGYSFGWWSGYESTFGPQSSHTWLFINGAGGVLYKLNNGLTLRAEIGYSGLKAGVGFLF